MSEETLHNPAAFPGHGTWAGQGMTLRDYFAGQALASIVGSAGFNAATHPRLAEVSYSVADAMLKERVK